MGHINHLLRVDFLQQGFFSVLQPGAAFLGICYILELESQGFSRLHLAFDFWPMAKPLALGLLDFSIVVCI